VQKVPRRDLRSLLSAILLALGTGSAGIRLLDWLGRADVLVTLFKSVPTWLQVLEHPLVALVSITLGLLILWYLAHGKKPINPILVGARGETLEPKKIPALKVALIAVAVGLAFGVALWGGVRAFSPDTSTNIALVSPDESGSSAATPAEPTSTTRPAAPAPKKQPANTSEKQKLKEAPLEKSAGPVESKPTESAPPQVAQVRITTQREIPSRNKEAPYGWEVIIQTNVTLPNILLNLVCTGPVSSGDILPSMDYTGMTVCSTEVAPDRNVLIARMASPPVVPERPLVVRIYSKTRIRVIELNWR
jgi:hypothetical protein